MDDVDSGHEFEAHWHDDGGVTLTRGGQSRTFEGRDSALRYVRDVARSSRHGRSLRVRTVAGEGPPVLLVSPSGNYYDENHPGIRGSISDVGAVSARNTLAPTRVPPPVAAISTPATNAPTPATNAPPPAPSAPSDSSSPRQASVVATLRETAAVADARSAGRRASVDREIPPPGAYVGRRRRESFVDDTPPELAPVNGWRGAVAKLGLKIEPSDAERAERVDQDAVSQHWPGPRTIAVVNGKGGSGKTPTTICLSATFAKWGGIGVLAWDNNQTRGTLGWRTERGQHEATTLDLIGRTERLTGPNAQMADLAHFVHHQRRDRFDVLRSQPMVLAAEQRLTPAHVEAIHGVASRYYRLIIMDSGNDESDPIWQEMIKHTDQLVLATTTRDDHAEAGALLLEALESQGGHAAGLAAGSVVVISQADVKATHDDLVRVRNGFTGLSREAVTIRYDHGMVDGALRLGNLKPTTQRDWLRAASAVARGL